MHIEPQYRFNSKPIPYSKIVYDQLIDNEDQDYCIPDEYSVKNANVKMKNQTNYGAFGYNNICYENEEEYDEFNEHGYNRTFTSGTFNENQSGNLFATPGDERRKLTHGLKNYKDIKSASFYANTSKDNPRSNSRSGSKNKRKLKLNEQQTARCEKQLAQCTFTPKTNNCRPPYRNFKEFTDFQEEFVSKRQAKLRKIKQQISEMQALNCTAQPAIDKNSRRISQFAESYTTMLNYDSTTRNNKKLPCHQRLYNIPQRKQGISTKQATFIPKILNKSKQIQRIDKVQNLLYEDAQRRLGQQKLLQSEAYQRQSLTKKYPSNFTPEKQMKHVTNNNRLLCNKIRTEFLQLLQIQIEDDDKNSNQNISPILAITILSQLFNVQLDPNKNEQLCLKVINYLISYENNEEGQKNGYVDINKLWDFVKAVIVGADGYEKGITSYTEYEVERINQELGYFYSKRLLKWPNRYEQQQEPQYRIETSEKTNRMAENYRNKKLGQITEFLQETKAELARKVYTEEKEQLFEKRDDEQIAENFNKKQERIIRLQDMLILNSIRHKTELEKRKLKKEQEQLRQCTFKPSINEKTTQILERRAKSRGNNKEVFRNGSHSKYQQNITKTQIKQSDLQNGNKEVSIEKVSKIVNKIKTIENKIPNFCKITKQKLAENETIPPQIEKKRVSTSAQKKIPKSDSKQETLNNVKDADKAILRYSLARKMKNVEATAKQRGYNAKSANWLKQIQEQKKQILGQLSNFLGYSGKNSSKEKQSKYNTNKTSQLYQSCQPK